MSVAELANSCSEDASKLLPLLKGSDSAVRYWAAIGFLVRDANFVASHQAELASALKDESASVRIVAAHALGAFGDDQSLNRALEALGELISPRLNGVLVSMNALAAVEALGDKAAPLHGPVRALESRGPSPDERFNSYVPRLIQNIIPVKTSSTPSKLSKPLREKPRPSKPM